MHPDVSEPLKQSWAANTHIHIHIYTHTHTQTCTYACIYIYGERVLHKYAYTAKLRGIIIKLNILYSQNNAISEKGEIKATLKQ